MPELEAVEIDLTPSEHQVNQLVWAEQGVPGKGIPRTWRAPETDAVLLVADDTGVKVSRDAGATAPTQVIVHGSPAGGGLSGTYPNPSVSSAGASAILPPGTIVAYAGAGTPVGWLPCDGGVVSRTTYPALFAAIGTTWGPGDGVSTFHLPALGHRTIMGSSPSRPVGMLGGDENGAAHTHVTNIDHLHPPITSGISSSVGIGSVSSAPPPSFSEDTHTHVVTPTHLGATSVTSAASSYPSTTANLAPYASVGFIIRAGV